MKGPIGDPGVNGTGGTPFDDAFHKTIVDNIADGVYYVDRDRTITYWNHGAERLTGFSAEEVVGRHCYADLLSHVDDSGTALCQNGCPLSATMADGTTRDAQVWLRHRAGHRRPVRVRTAPVYAPDGAIVGAVELFDDATGLREARDEVQRAQRDALTDQLTGLPNRRHFDASLVGRLENLKRYGWGFGLLIADIDHFKQINDAHGHELGDAALQTVAATIAGGVRTGDLAARWGGEEFAILVEAVDDDALRATAERLRVLVARSTIRDGRRPVRVRISVGGALAVRGSTVAELFGSADQALYAAKAGGRDRVVIAVEDTEPVASDA